MKKYIRLYYYLFYYSLLSRLEYRMDFIANIIRSLSSILVGLIGFTVIFQNTHYLGGWSKEEALVLFGIFVLINELWYIFFFLNLIRLPTYIQKGELDGLLLKPVSIQFIVSFRYALVFALPNIFIAIFMIWYFSQVIGQISLMKYVITGLFIFNGVVLLYSMTLMLVTISFWTVRLKAFWEFYRAITEGARYPVDIFKGGLKLFFTFIIPIAVIFTFPAQYLVRDLPISTILITFLIGVIFLFLSHKFFYYGLKHYNSASS